MKATWPQSAGGSRRRLLASIVVLVLGLGGLVAACRSTESTTTVAAVTTTEAVTTTQSLTTTSQTVATTSEVLVPMSAAEIGRWKTDAIAFWERFDAAFPDTEAQLAALADDATFY